MVDGEHAEPEDFGYGPFNVFFHAIDYLLSSHTIANVLIIVLVVLAAIPILGVNFLATRSIQWGTATIPSPAPAADEIRALFACPHGASIEATFSGDVVHLTLSDGRRLTLPRAMSASGARYANADESFVFWNKGDTAFIDEHGERTYDGCVAGE